MGNRVLGFVKRLEVRYKLKKILIIYPHFPPSNLAGVHRPRLFAQHLPSFNWEPVVLTVHEKYYEESLDYNLEKLLPKALRIEKVNAFPVTRPRLVGDIGLRGFFQLYKKAKLLLQTESFNFVYIPIPSFYCALLGRLLHATTGVPYGIDYIDPWVHHFPGSDRFFSRHWFSTQIAKLLEPIAVKKAALITGVAEGYYADVLKRNPHLHKAVTGGMPYGGEERDHQFVASLDIEPYLFEQRKDKLQLVYAGAMLPKAYQPLEVIFACIKNHLHLFSDVEFHFIGTGSRVNDANSYNIKPLAEKYGLFNKVVFEYPKRIPYLDVLVHLNIADGIFILGSTEPHYTPSKTYQAVLSGKYILAVLHEKSTAVAGILQSGAGEVLQFNGEQDMATIAEKFLEAFQTWRERLASFSADQVNMQVFNQYAAREVTAKLAGLLEKAVQQ